MISPRERAPPCGAGGGARAQAVAARENPTCRFVGAGFDGVEVRVSPKLRLMSELPNGGRDQRRNTLQSLDGHRTSLV